MALLTAYLGVLIVCVVPATSVRADDAAAEQSPQQADAFFKEQVKPILAEHCLECHGAAAEAKGGLHLVSRSAVLEGGDSGPSVDLDEPAASLLLEAINYQSFEMPPKGKLPAEKIAVLTRWVELGLPFPSDEEQEIEAHESAVPEVNEAAKQFWSFQPVRRPPVAQPIDSEGWVKSPIDAYVLERLQRDGLRPSPPADKLALLRRATYDLTGLPPTPEEIASFLADDSPRAFERVVDRLLDSPHYGEHWGRHWLDLVRYAETNSFERDGAKPHVWKYRDYVIQSLNDDKPYDQFVMEQLAGDELDEVTPESIIATGYYRLGAWDDEPSDPQQALYDDLDDILSTTGQVFLGLTISCARCHDHKLDPIPQTDYYRMLAFVRGVRRYGQRAHETVLAASVRPIASAEERERHAEEVQRYQDELAKVDADLAQIENLVEPTFSDVEREEFRHWQNRKAIVARRVGQEITAEQLEQYERLRRARMKLERNPPAGLDAALCVTEHGSEAPETFVLIRGNPHAPGEKVEPGFPSVLSPPEPRIVPRGESSGRRRALAEWIVSPDNPLTARVIANRVWQYHFGRGLVRSSSNFGNQGDRPTHPELLDWLASDLVEHGWRLKRLHRLIMLSSTYQMSSGPSPESFAVDPENNALWRFDMRRLTAEEVRDSILAVNGSLNRSVFGGPSFFPKLPQAILQTQSQPGAGWGDSPASERARRSIYAHVKRSLLVPILVSFDAADVDASCPVRFSTTQPTQALTMLNSDFMAEEADVFARFVRQQGAERPEDMVTLVLNRVLQRPPRENEVARGTQLLAEMQEQHGVNLQEALRLYCLVALNLNEFIYLD